jgi:hypothetical protein
MMDDVSRRGILIGFSALATAAASGLPLRHAQAAGDPFALETEYQADALFGSGTRAQPGRFGRTREAIRQEVDGGGGTHTIIVRLDQRVAWTMLPGVRVVIECDLHGLNLPVAALTGSGGAGLRKVAGPRETVGGVPTTRYRVEALPPTQAQFVGDVWASDRGVVMKIVGEGAYGGRRTDLSASFRNVREGRQDPNLFQLPGGYRRVIVPLDNLQVMIDSLSRMSLPR